MEIKNERKRNLKLITNIIISLVVVFACMFLLPRLVAFFMPFIVGWIISCIANPMVVFLERRIKIKRKAGTVVVIVCAIAVVIGVGYLVFSILFRQLAGFITDVPQMWSAMVQELNDFGERVTRIMGVVSPNFSDIMINTINAIGNAITELPSKFDSETFEGMGTMVGSIANIIISIIMSILSSYFFISDREWLGKAIDKFVPNSILKKYEVFYNSIKQAVGGYFKAQFRIELWIYILILIGLVILDVKYAILIALLIAILDFLPFFGSGAVFLPWAIISFLCGEYVRTIGFLIIWGVGQLVRQLIQPKIMGDSIGMEPLPTLFLLYIGYKAAGVIGMIIAVPIGIIVVNMNDAGFFNTPKYSLRILVKNLNKFRQLNKDDMSILEDKD